VVACREETTVAGEEMTASDGTGFKCQFTPCDDKAECVVELKGQDPVKLCTEHGELYADWLCLQEPPIEFRKRNI